MDIFEEILLCEKDMEMVQSILQEKLKLSFEKHESDYWGIYFICKNIKGMNNIKIMNNYVDDDWQQPDFPHCPIIIYLNNVYDNDKFFKKIVLILGDNIEKIYIYEQEKGIYEKQYIFEKGEKILIKEKKYRKD